MPRHKSRKAKSYNNNKPQVAKSPTPSPNVNQNNHNLLGGLLGTVTQGFAFGTGSSIAHLGVDAVVGNNNQVSKDSDFHACKIIFQQYQQCLESEWNPNACMELP
jgi:hypothetical protein